MRMMKAQESAAKVWILIGGNSNLNINGNEKAAYSGSAQLKNVNIGGEFLFCGSLAIENNLNINSNGLMHVVGSFAFGKYRKNTSINVNSNSTLRLTGSTVIYGDLRLNSGATLEFVGEDNVITIYGDVQINSGARVIGRIQRHRRKAGLKHFF